MLEHAREHQRRLPEATAAARTRSPAAHLGSPESVRHLQRLIGNAAMGRLVAPPPQRRLQRLKLSPAAIVTAVERIPFMKTKLGGTLRGETMRVQVERAVAAFETMFGAAHRGRTDNAVMLAIALNGVARMIAEELYDPTIQSELAGLLFEQYESELKTATGLGGEEDRSGAYALKLTEVLVSDDPLGLYMHGELRIDVAADRIRQMAQETGLLTGEDKSPARMFDLLRHKWEAEMAAHSAQKLKAAEPKGAYSVKEATGELSEAYFKKLFGAIDGAPAQSGEGLTLTAAAEQKLGLLRAEVVLPGPRVDPASFVPRYAGMTSKQERHLSEIEQAEQPAVLADARTRLADAIADSLLVSTSEAKAMVATIDTWLRTVPLTITVWGKDWFEAGVPAQTAFRPATRQVKTKTIAEVFEKPGATGSISHAGKYEHETYGAERGDKYLRFRRWKDELLTGLLDFGPAELPVFGAANVNWERTRGSAEGGIKEGAEIPVGTNYYGDTHFLLRDAVRDRVVYTATDHGPPRRDPLLALLDFVTGENITGLLAKRNPTMLLEVVNAARAKALNLRAELPFEIQIFGGLDIARDVERIYYAPGVTPAVKQHIADFCTAVPSVGKEEIAGVADKTTMVSAGAATVRDIRTGIRAALLKETGHGGDVRRAKASLTGMRYEYTLQALALLRVQVQTDQDLARVRAQAAELSSVLAFMDPTVAETFIQFKKVLDTIT
jgi:hypothetical protein